MPKMPEEAQTKSLILLAVLLCVSGFLFIIYCVLLCTFDSKIIEKIGFTRKSNVTAAVVPETQVQKIAELPFVDALYFDATNKPPATFGWE